MRFLGFGRKVGVYLFSRKMCFNENVCFTSFCGKMHLAVLAEKGVFPFCEKIHFFVIAKKCICKKKIEFTV